MIYLNNAATTWPKPEAVYKAVDDCLRSMNSPMRASVSNLKNYDTNSIREIISKFFEISDPKRLIFTAGCTYSLNLAIKGIKWTKDDLILMSGLEHHAVSRPIRNVCSKYGAKFEVIPFTNENPINFEYLETKLKTGKVKLVACTMASNVTGHIMPVKHVIDLSKRYGAMSLIDCAQSAGLIKIDISDLNPDFMTFAGHKGLFSPPGVGGLYIGSNYQLETLIDGGTGQDSGKHEVSKNFPTSYETGTINIPAIVGLKAGIDWVSTTGLGSIREHELNLTREFVSRLAEIRSVKIYGPADPAMRTSVVSLNISGKKPKDVAAHLYETYGIITRAGYHCAPLAHETIGTLPGDGTVRISFGFFNTIDDVLSVSKCISDLAN